MSQGLMAAIMSRENGPYETDPTSKGSRSDYQAAPTVASDPNHLIVQPTAEPLVYPQTSSLRILAVDDDPLVLMNITALLEDLGHSVIEAPSGKAALEILRNGQHIDLLVTDQSMPGMTGIELAAAASDTTPGIRIVIATGYAELPAGSVSFVTLQKPFLDDDLARAIDRAMNGQIMGDRG